MVITVENITTLVQAQQLRVLRNECAEWMTRDTAQITVARQRRFFREKIATGNVEGFLLLDDGEPVAYGMLVWDADGRAWSSTGVKAAARGKRLGTIATREVINRAAAHGVPVWAEVRQDNAGQQKICAVAGYELMGVVERDGVTVDVMRCEPPA